MIRLKIMWDQMDKLFEGFKFIIYLIGYYNMKNVYERD